MTAGGVKLTGQKELEKLLEQLPEKIRRKSVRKAVTAGAAVIVRAAKQKAKLNKRSGALAKSINKVVRTGKDKASVYAFIGVLGSAMGGWAGKVIRPLNYLHLIEEDHLTRDGRLITGTHFMRNAASEKQGEAAKAFTSKLGAAIELEAAKLKGKK